MKRLLLAAALVAFCFTAQAAESIHAADGSTRPLLDDTGNGTHVNVIECVVVNSDGSITKGSCSGSGGGTSVQQTASLTPATASGSVAAGATTVSFYASGSASPAVAGASIATGTAVTFQAAPGNTLGAIAYTASSTATLLISTVR